MARKPGRPRKTTKTAQTAQATAQGLADHKPTTPRVKPGPPEPRTYENIAKRVLSAVEEFNAAFQEAYDFSDITVQACVTDLENEKPPLQVRQCRIFKLTDSVPEIRVWSVVPEKEYVIKLKSRIAAELAEQTP